MSEEAEECAIALTVLAHATRARIEHDEDGWWVRYAGNEYWTRIDEGEYDLLRRMGIEEVHEP
jgi:hypothetical protein